jgi:hypothetical protein
MRHLTPTPFGYGRGPSTVQMAPDSPNALSGHWGDIDQYRNLMPTGAVLGYNI